MANPISVKSKGERTKVSLRPERALINPKDKMDNIHNGKIEEVIYHGDHTRVRINLLGNPEFILNKPQYQGASILLTRENFGCGSSREHAPWALEEYGFRVIISPSFADIFYGNCINIGLLPIRLTEDEIEELFVKSANENIELTVDLANNVVSCGDASFSFSVDTFHQYCLEQGIDSVGWTLKKLDTIKAFEEKMPAWQ